MPSILQPHLAHRQGHPGGEASPHTAAARHVCTHLQATHSHTGELCPASQPRAAQRQPVPAPEMQSAHGNRPPARSGRRDQGSTGRVRRGKERLSVTGTLLLRRDPPPSAATGTAGTSSQGLAGAARESGGVGTCQEPFSRPHGTDSARSGAHLQRRGKRETRGRRLAPPLTLQSTGWL